MIRQTTTVTNNLGDIQIFLDGYREDAAAVFVATGDEIRPQALAALGETPGAVKRQIEWTLSPLPAGRSPNMPNGQYSKQKAAFFATDGFGKGIPYVRRSGPGNAQGAWQFKTDVGSPNSTSPEFKAIIQNPDPASQFIYGSLAKSNPGRFQQRFHINTGWLNGFREASFWMNAFNVMYRKNLRQRFSERARSFNTNRRAYTNRRQGV